MLSISERLGKTQISLQSCSLLYLDTFWGMEEVKDFEGIPSGKSSAETSSVEHPHNDLEPSASSVNDEKGKNMSDRQQSTATEAQISTLLNTSSDQKPPIPSKSSDAPGSIVNDILDGLSKGQCILATHSSDHSKEELNNVASQIEDATSVTEAHILTVSNHTSLDEPGKTEDKLYMLPNDLEQLHVEVENVLYEASTSCDANETPHQFHECTSTKSPVVEANNHHNSSGEIGKTDDDLHLLPKKSHDHHQVEVGNTLQRTPQLPDPSDRVKQVTSYRALVDTAAPFESVKEAVTKFGGIVDWKAHKAQTLERRKNVQFELQKVQEEIPDFKKKFEAAEVAKVQVLKELDNTKRFIEELKLNLERAQMEEAQAKQDCELAQLRVQEMEQGIGDEASVAAKAQIEVAKARHAAAVAELKSTKEVLEALRREYVSLVGERDTTIERAEEAVSASKEIEKTVEELTFELIRTKESVEYAHAAHLEAEEHRIGAALAREQDVLTWEKELKQAEEEVKQLNEQLLLTEDLKAKLDSASTLLLELKGELATYIETKLNQESKDSFEEKPNDEGETNEVQTSMQVALASTRKELEEVKMNIEKAKSEVDILIVVASSLKSELDSEKAALTSLRQMEGMASIAVSSLEAELERTKAEIELVRAKEKETREKMVELPKLLQQAAQEADKAKSAAQLAREELKRSKEEAEHVKASANTMEIRLHATLKEIEAAKASERLALAAIKALEESDQAAIMGSDELHSGVTLSLEEYYELSRRAHEAEELANERVRAAIAEIQVAKDSELKSMLRLSEATKDLGLKKEALRIALNKAEKAKDGKLGVEQELRRWRAEHEQQRKASDASQGVGNSSRSPPKGSEDGREPKSFSTDNTSSMFVRPTSHTKFYMSQEEARNTVPEVKIRKKRSFFPRIIMFLARKKSQSLK
ncbi:hypothetical protein J5N97_009807 [Dioscorea zingiberensis]|uniref:Protein WEAK CHLOROPLAST MOVEMENT UNDER BLUE LIGHT 1-like n=1 Tax=Dioscorea zingiberensis TaxID=325984 RepID=A0A9D5CZH0_9LILI|nr:hypothetical protein J5N97_009807 [Dioscorea zingiberensis]